MSLGRGPAMLALALALAASSPARAEPAIDAAETTARAIGDEGLRRFNAGKFQEAYDLLQRAERTFHAPTLVLYMAHCQVRLGNPRDARRLYRDVVREVLTPDAPPQFHAARAIAAQELKGLAARLATVRISLTGPPAREARVMVDRVDVPSADRDDVVVEPGEHVVEAWIPGSATARRAINVFAGRTVEVELALPAPRRAGDRGPGPALRPLEDPAAAASAPRPPRDSTGFLVPAGISLGAGGAALVVGTITGVLSLRAAGDVRSQCRDGQCPSSEQAYATSTERMANVSTGAFVAGGAALVTGIVLSVVHVRERRAHPASDAGALHVDVGPGYGALRGAF